MEDVLDGHQHAVQRRPAGRIGETLFQCGGFGVQPFPAAWFGEQRLDVRVNRVDAVTQCVDIRKEIRLAVVQRGCGGCKWSGKDHRL